MLRSMTGYGRGEATHGGIRVVVEARAVNHRFADVVVRGPRAWLALEGEVVAAVKAVVARGRVEVHVHRDAPEALATVEVDRGLFAAWADALAGVVGDRPDVLARGLAAALADERVVRVRVADVDAAAEAPALRAALGDALQALDAARAREGEALGAELRRLAAELEAVVTALEAGTAEAPGARMARLRERLEALAGAVSDPVRLAQEAAALADRADVTEEIARIRAHLGALDAALGAADAASAGGDGAAGAPATPVGRRVEFLLQELGREVNTLGSKVADAALGLRVVDAKAILERLREQAANVE
jgi:uncharacterized protein (TIGR00255 family)